MLSHHADYAPKDGCGCGRYDAAIDMVPDSFWFGTVNWKPACCIHDDRYERGGSEADKVEADREFLDNLLWIADSSRGKWYVPTWWARHRAMTYYDAVIRAGAKSFNYTED